MCAALEACKHNFSVALATSNVNRAIYSRANDLRNTSSTNDGTNDASPKANYAADTGYTSNLNFRTGGSNFSMDLPEKNIVNIQEVVNKIYLKDREDVSAEPFQVCTATDAINIHIGVLDGM